jgi:hypothetical protein
VFDRTTEPNELHTLREQGRDHPGLFNFLPLHYLKSVDSIISIHKGKFSDRLHRRVKNAQLQREKKFLEIGKISSILRLWETMGKMFHEIGKLFSVLRL